MTPEILNTIDTEEEDELYTSDSYDPYNIQDEIDVREDPQSVYEWMRRYKSKRLIIDPDFQRNRVWKDYQRSRFIESLLMGIPLPPLYVNQTREGSYLLIDGLQRTTTLYSYIEEKSFALDTGLETIIDARNKRFDELPPLYQARIEDRKMLVYVIKPSVDIRVVYDIFDRINSGGTPLNRQELRNSYFNGPSTRLLKELAECGEFKQAISHGISSDRMRDREAVLRCLAFHIHGISNYQHNIDAFLRETMLGINKMSDTQRNIIQDEFRRVMRISYEVLGEQTFRIPIPGSRGRINVAIMESVYLFFAKLSNEKALANSTHIKNNYMRLLNNSEYLEAVTRSTGTRSRVISRFRLADEILGDGLC